MNSNDAKCRSCGKYFRAPSGMTLCAKCFNRLADSKDLENAMVKHTSVWLAMRDMIKSRSRGGNYDN